jgi:UDP-GlcNAc3NAcA epimerase
MQHMKVLSVVGARPQFIKAAVVSRQLRQSHHELLLHTGQHYDHGMSQVFFDEMGIPSPDINLDVGSASHGQQTASMLVGIEQAIQEEMPDCVLVYGDTNSTLAGALAAVKLHVPLAHVEAGLRSFDRRMPEEVNRVVADHVADLLFCPNATSVCNLAAEGIRASVYNTGDVMMDALLFYAPLAERNSTVLARLGLRPGAYLLATIHRPANTDTGDNLRAIVDALSRSGQPVVFPVHPRTAQALDGWCIKASDNVRLVEPVGYFDMLQLERSARLVITDSGGVQKEAYMLGVPCVTLRPETEWVETVQAGWNVLAGADGDKLLDTIRNFVPPAQRPHLFGDGHAAERIVRHLEES